MTLQVGDRVICCRTILGCRKQPAPVVWCSNPTLQAPTHLLPPSIYTLIRCNQATWITQRRVSGHVRTVWTGDIWIWEGNFELKIRSAKATWPPPYD